MRKHPIAWFLTLVVLIILADTAATQYLAWRYDYHPALGAPLVVVQEYPLYAPWRLMEWYQRYGVRDKALYSQAGLIGVGVLALMCLLIWRFLQCPRWIATLDDTRVIPPRNNR